MQAALPRAARTNLTAKFILGALTLLAGGAASEAATATHKVRMFWNYGIIEVELYGTETPRHVANFMMYADSGRYDSTFVHRVEAGSARFVQGGGFHVPDPLTTENLLSDPVESFPQIANEFDASNGLSNIAGSLAAARQSHPDTATAQWFFNVTDNSGGFDAGPYTVYGQITSGFDEWFQFIPYQTQLQDVDSSTIGSYEATTPLVGGQYLVILGQMMEVSLQAGDFNNDGVVDQADHDIWEAEQGTSIVSVADANGDYNVDDLDYDIWEANLGQGALRVEIAGDYNRDGTVDEADYLWWETTFGSTLTLDADGNNNGVIDQADYTVWRDAFAAASGSLAIPEPASIALALSIAAAGLVRRR